MTLQLYKPNDVDQDIASPCDAQQAAEQLIARLIAETKQNRQLEDATVKVGGWIAAAMQLVDELGSERHGRQKVRLKDFESGRAIHEADEETQKAAVFLALKHQASQNYIDRMTDRVCESVLSSLLRKKLPYTNAEIVELLKPIAETSFIFTGLPIAPILTNVERHAAEHGVCDSIRQQLQRMAKEYHSGATYNDARKAGKRIDALLALPPRATAIFKKPEPMCKVARRAPGSSVAFDFNTGEAWTNALLIALGELSDASRIHWHEFLTHCGTAKGSKPTQKFIKQSRDHIEAIGSAEFIQVLSQTLSEIGQPGESQRFNYGGRIEFGEATQIHDTHVDCLRGLVWTTSLVNDESLIGVVGDAAEKCFQKIREVGPRSPKIGNACLIALSSLASEFAVAQLGRLNSRAKHVSTRKQISKAFQQAAANAGMTEADLIEIGVPTFGLTEVGRLHEAFGDFTAEATFGAHTKHMLVWRRQDGKTQKSVPAVVKESCGEQLKQLKLRLKNVDKLMPSLRHRIEHLFLNERSWSLMDFRKRYLDHPLVGIIARRLIWNAEQDHETTAVIWHEGLWVTSNGDSFEPGTDCRISIWHPLRCSADAVLQWRRWLDSHRVSQPFKQAHREVYILTDAERATVDHSNRFASHIIRQHQFAALCQQRGWRFDLQGDWDSWNAPYLDLPQHALQVVFDVDPMEGRNEVTQSFIYAQLATEQVQFFPMLDGAPDVMNPIALETLDPIVFSEVMRDVDLFVGVTSIGNDPEWRERGTEREHIDYWETFSFGELSQTAITRKQTLEQILPQLQIADRCHLDGRFLIVKGKLRTYKIHLGSSNILMSPDDRYLCIVQKRGSGARRTDGLYLPFEGDNTLSLILSKAFLLASDDTIRDQSIINQIRTDRP